MYLLIFILGNLKDAYIDMGLVHGGYDSIQGKQKKTTRDIFPSVPQVFGLMTKDFRYFGGCITHIVRVSDYSIMFCLLSW